MVLSRYLLSFSLVFVSFTAYGQTPVIRDRMQRFVDEGEISGAVTVVGHASGIVHHEAVGLAKIEGNVPMLKDTMFRIASMTKPITAMGVMLLVEEGKIAVDDPVEKHLPEFKGQMLVSARDKETITLKKPARPITIKDLLTHTSGLPGGYPSGIADVYTKRNRTLNDTTLVISQQPLNFEPGTKWSYCNAGIDTLGRIIEVVSGEPYEKFLQDRIFDPLAMKDTTFYPNAEQVTRTATNYGKKDGKLVAAPNTLLDYTKGAKHPVPAGGLFSTGADLAKLYGALLNKGKSGTKTILSEKSLAEMTTIHTGDLKAGFVDGTGFGYGFAIVREPIGVTDMLSPGTFGHGGAFGTQGWIDPKHDLFMILLIQRNGLANGDASPMRKELQRLAVATIAK